MRGGAWLWFKYERNVLEGVYGYGAMAFRLGLTRDEVVYGLERLGGKEDLAALSADLCRHVPQDVHATLPVVDMLNASVLNEALTERTRLHG